MSGTVAAVDLGATSGRVVLGRFAGTSFDLSTVHRFPNTPVETTDGLHWNVLELYRNILVGLRKGLQEEPALSSVAVDSWAVDYALMNGGRMLGTPYHYRDRRSEKGVKSVHATVSREELYQRNGLQFLPFNTLYQLITEDPLMLSGDSLLLIPDLVTYWLSGRQVCEITNASTTGLLNVQTRQWDTDLMARLGLPAGIFKTLVEPGTTVGGLSTAVAEGLGSDNRVVVTSVGSHDTASAVVGVPMVGDGAAYISCGTWGLVGVELEHPVLTDDSRNANFTNEGGVDGRTRFLHNVMGLWLLSESIRQWEREGETIDLDRLVQQAGDVTAPTPVFDANDPRFLAPGDIPSRIRDACAELGLATPRSRPEFVRSILESLAEAFARSIQRAAELSGRTVTVVHIVGGGCQNRLLCQLTANRSERTVLAGPVEATAVGNVLIQARAHGYLSGDLEALRSLVAESHELIRYEPQATSKVPCG